MLWNRQWNASSLIRLVSGLLLVLGVSNLVPVLIMSMIGSSHVDTADLKDPAGLAKSLITPTQDAHPAATYLGMMLTTAERQTLSRAASSTNAPPKEIIGNALTNLLNRALEDSGLRSTTILQSTNTHDRTRGLAAAAATPLQAMQVNRQVMQDAFPTQLTRPRHWIEVASSVAFFIPFSLATICMQLGFFYTVRQFLRDELMTWGDLLQGRCAQPQQAIGIGVGAGLCALVLMWPVSAASSWFWQQMHHTSQLQQPLRVLQQADHPLQLAFFSLVAVAAAPFFEEIFFRGLLFSTLRQRGWGRAAGVVSAIAFGAIHFDLEKFLPLAFLGWILVYVYETTGSLLAPILAHATFNTANLVLFLCLPKITEAVVR